jgi:hypothetical protein
MSTGQPTLSASATPWHIRANARSSATSIVIDKNLLFLLTESPVFNPIVLPTSPDTPLQSPAPIRAHP